MSDLRARLVECFAAVFPSLPAQAIPMACMTSLESWDSMASATLLATIEEEFGVIVQADDLDQFVSFDSVLEFLRTSQAHARG